MSNPIKLVEVYSHYTQEDRIVTKRVKKYNGLNLEVDVCLAVLVVVTQDFDPNNKINRILEDTCSFQIRPKALYKSKKGIFYKDGKERRYLTNQELIDLMIENKELGSYLRWKVSFIESEKIGYERRHSVFKRLTTRLLYG